MPTVIARHSDSPPDYTSGLTFCMVNPLLNRAAKLAWERNLLSDQAERIIRKEVEEYEINSKRPNDYFIAVANRYKRKNIEPWKPNP